MEPGLAAVLCSPQLEAVAQTERMRASSDATSCSPLQEQTNDVAVESPRRIVLRRRATVAFGAIELQGRLSDMALEAVAEETKREQGEEKLGSNPALPKVAKEAEDLDQIPTRPPYTSSGEVRPQKKRNRLFIPVLRRQSTKA
jgi:hypothetical protein